MTQIGYDDYFLYKLDTFTNNTIRKFESNIKYVGFSFIMVLLIMSLGICTTHLGLYAYHKCCRKCDKKEGEAPEFSSFINKDENCEDNDKIVLETDTDSEMDVIDAVFS